MCESKCMRPNSENFIKKHADKKGDHFTFLKIYQEYESVSDKDAWIRKYGIRLDLLKLAKNISDNYYYKTVNLSRNKIDTMNRLDAADTEKNILQALKNSHQHLIAKKLIPQFPKKKATGAVISKDSVVNINHKRQELAKKTFVYDELVNINGSFEYTIITFI